MNGLGRYEEALAAAVEASEQGPRLHIASWALPELIEAATRTDQPALARDALDRLGEHIDGCDSDWALGLHARSCALLSEGDAAESLYREAVDRLSRTQLRPELARAHLLYGEWLRRQGQRVDAREQLRTAHEMFATIGMEAFAERAGRELVATGEKVRSRTIESQTVSRRKRRRSPSWRTTVSRTRRSGHGCSSARGRSSGTSARSSPSST